MELLWIALFGLLCTGILGLIWACERWLAPAVSSAINAAMARPGSLAEGSAR